MIYALLGPSGSGKTTLLGNLRKHSRGLLPLESVTTRAKRPTDEEGEYTYVDKETFLAMKSREEFAWDVFAFGSHYGTRKIVADEALSSELIYVPILLPEGLHDLARYAAKTNRLNRVKPIYLSLHDIEVLRKRMTGRGDSNEAELALRLAAVSKDLHQFAALDLQVFFIDATLTKEEVLHKALNYMGVRDTRDN